MKLYFHKNNGLYHECAWNNGYDKDSRYGLWLNSMYKLENEYLVCASPKSCNIQIPIILSLACCVFSYRDPKNNIHYCLGHEAIKKDLFQGEIIELNEDLLT